MKNKLLSNISCSMVFALICSFTSSAKAMEESENWETITQARERYEPSDDNVATSKTTSQVGTQYKHMYGPLKDEMTPSTARPGFDDYAEKKTEEAETKAKKFTDFCHIQMEEKDAKLLIDSASKPTLKKILELKNDNSIILMNYCLRSLYPNADIAHFTKSFELAQNLWSQKSDLITVVQKNEFLKHLASRAPEQILSYCKKGVYIKFFQENQENLLEGINQSNKDPKEKADFWDAMVNHIRPTLSFTQWKQAAEKTLEAAQMDRVSEERKYMYACVSVECFINVEDRTSINYRKAKDIVSKYRDSATK